MCRCYCKCMIFLCLSHCEFQRNHLAIKKDLLALFFIYCNNYFCLIQIFGGRVCLHTYQKTHHSTPLGSAIKKRMPSYGVNLVWILPAKSACCNKPSKKA